MNDDQRNEGPFDIATAGNTTIEDDDLGAVPDDLTPPFDVGAYHCTGRNARKAARRTLKRRRERRAEWAARPRRR